MTEICLMFEVHQPLRLNRNFHIDLLNRQSVKKEELFSLYFDNNLNKHIFKRASRKCYLPSNNIILEQIDRFKGENKKFKVTFGISGAFLEQCERWSTDLLESFKQLGKTGCVEFLEETYFHSLASLYDVHRTEFVSQITMHQQLVNELFNYSPKVFENTECLYNNAIAETIKELGYKAIVTEGTAKILGWRSPNYVYKAKESSLPILLRNYNLSDDIGFRFSSSRWEEWPLTAEKYASWLSSTLGQTVNIFVDYETFGEHHWPETGVHEFLRWLPGEVIKWDHLKWATPSEVVNSHPPVGEVDVPEFSTISWADLERDTSAWMGNRMQKASYEFLKGLEPLVKGLGNKEMLRIWRYFQMSDHLYYMSTKGAGSGDVHSYFNPYESPIEAFTIFSRILSDFEARLFRELERPELTAKWVLRQLPTDKGFTLFYDFARPTIVTVFSLEEFHSALEKVDISSIQFHMVRGDFERWLNQVVGDEKLARQFVLTPNLKDEALRKKILEIVATRIKQLRIIASKKKASQKPLKYETEKSVQG